MSTKCLTNWNGHLLRPGGISPPCFSFTRSIVEQCLLKKDKYMPPAHSLKTARSSHSAQYRRHQTYSDALKYSSPPPAELFHVGIVCLLLWPISSPLRSLGHSLFKTKIRPNVFVCVFFVCVFFCLFFAVVFFFILSKFQNLVLPDVMLKFERSQ